MKTGVLTPFSFGSDERAAANGPTVARLPAKAASRSANTSGSTRFGSSEPRKPAITPDLREPLRHERLAEVGPADRDRERRPRDVGDERVPGRAAAVRDAPAADAVVGDVGPVAKPAEDRLDVGDLLRAVDPDQAARAAVPARVVGEHGVALADDPHRLRERQHVAAVPAEPVHVDHGGPAGGRRRAGRERQGRGERRPVGRGDRHVLAREGAGGGGERERPDDREQQEERACHGGEG